MIEPPSLGQCDTSKETKDQPRLGNFEGASFIMEVRRYFQIVELVRVKL